MSLVVRTIPLTKHKQKTGLKLLVEGRPDEFTTHIKDTLKSPAGEKLHRRHIAGWNILTKYVVNATRDQKLFEMVNTCKRDPFVLNIKNRIESQGQQKGFLDRLQGQLSAVNAVSNKENNDKLEHEQVENIWDSALKMMYNHQDNLELGQGSGNSSSGSSSNNAHIRARKVKDAAGTVNTQAKAEVSKSKDVSVYRTEAFDFDMYEKLKEELSEKEKIQNKNKNKNPDATLDKEIDYLIDRITHIEESAYLLYSKLGDTYSSNGISITDLETENNDLQNIIDDPKNTKNQKDIDNAKEILEKNNILKANIEQLKEIIEKGQNSLINKSIPTDLDTEWQIAQPSKPKAKRKAENTIANHRAKARQS